MTFLKKVKFKGSICANRVFYLPIFRRIEVGVESTPPRPCGTEKSVVLRGLRRGEAKG